MGRPGMGGKAEGTNRAGGEGETQNDAGFMGTCIKQVHIFIIRRPQQEAGKAARTKIAHDGCCNAAQQRQWHRGSIVWQLPLHAAAARVQEQALHMCRAPAGMTPCERGRGSSNSLLHFRRLQTAAFHSAAQDDLSSHPMPSQPSSQPWLWSAGGWDDQANCEED